MPHAFKASPDHPAVAYLVRLHADIGGQIQANKTESERLAQAMLHVEAVLKLFDPAYNLKAISARRRQNRNPWFKRGTMFRVAIDAMRTAGRPLTVAEITDAVIAARKITDATKEQRSALEAALRSCLERSALVQRVGEGMPRRWRLLG